MGFNSVEWRPPYAMMRWVHGGWLIELRVALRPFASSDTGRSLIQGIYRGGGTVYSWLQLPPHLADEDPRVPSPKPNHQKQSTSPTQASPIATIEPAFNYLPIRLVYLSTIPLSFIPKTMSHRDDIHFESVNSSQTFNCFQSIGIAILWMGLQCIETDLVFE